LKKIDFRIHVKNEILFITKSFIKSLGHHIELVLVILLRVEVCWLLETINLGVYHWNNC